MQRIAIVDLGSNTAKLVALAYQPGHSWRQLDELRAVVRLSQGMGAGGPIQPKPFARGLAALRSFHSYAEAAGVDHLVATTTSAVRDASNGAEFVAAAADIGVALRTLAGEEEASVAALAVANGLNVQDAVTMDLGGGSFQLSQLRARRWCRGGSWPLGAVRATERFLSGDPPKGKGLKALAAAAREAADGWLAAGEQQGPFVGVGGTIRNLANVHQQRLGYPLDLLHGYRLPVADLRELATELSRLSAAQRAELPGLNRDRADIIAAGAVVIAEVVRAAGASEVLISGQGLREGLFYPYLLPAHEDALLDDVRGFSVLNLMRQYYDEPAHNEHVRALALSLFDQTQRFHGLAAAERELLGHAAMLHDIGLAVDYYRHEHHGKMLVLSRPLPGFDHAEQVMLALLVRYHRKGTPSLEGYAGIMPADALASLRTLSGLLRLAEYLDRGKAQRVSSVELVDEGGDLLLLARSAGEAIVEVEAASLRRDLLEQALGRKLKLRAADGAEVDA